MPLNQTSSIIISLLFASGDPLSVYNLAKLIKISREETEKALAKAREVLETTGLRIISSAGKYQLVTDPAQASFVKKLVKKKEEKTLGGAGLEVLAITAYRKGATEEEIEMIRGVKSSRAIRNLMIKGMLVSKGKKGAPRYYPSLSLLRSLGVESEEDLPDYQKFAENEKLRNFLTQEKKATC